MAEEAGGNGNGVRVTNKEIYELALDTKRSVDLLVQRDDDADAIHKDQEVRIRRLEVLAWKVMGALCLVAFFFSAFGYFIAQAVVHK